MSVRREVGDDDIRGRSLQERRQREKQKSEWEVQGTRCLRAREGGQEEGQRQRGKEQRGRGAEQKLTNHGARDQASGVFR